MLLCCFSIRSMWRSASPRIFLIGIFSSLLSLAGCFFIPSMGQIPQCPKLLHNSEKSLNTLPLSQLTPHAELLQQSWIAYRQRFIQADGRVIDREADDRTTSEGQAYAMLRAVLINDPETFACTFNWAENNLARRDSEGKLIDHLWAWKWGRTGLTNWQIQDSNFASDADIDAVTALILAAYRWNSPHYLEIARTKLKDLWLLSTAVTPDGSRYLLPGPKQAFWNQPEELILNPSYFAPYAFRLFAQNDPTHNWMELVDSSYRALERSSQVSKVGLPSDWIVLNPKTGNYQPLPASHSLRSLYSFDAYRVWWRIALDANWFQEARAKQYLQRNIQHLRQLWQTQQKIPARIGLDGQPTVSYEATPQYAMLYSALNLIDPQIAEQVYQKKLSSQYRHGFWDNDSAYYTQNLVWFALLPTASFPALLPNNP